MIRIGVAAFCWLLAGCSTEAVRTPQQAMDIALSSVCAAAQVKLKQGESMPTEWMVERKGGKWHAWLPPDPNGPDKQKGAWLKGAWINARDGEIDHCEIRLFNYAPVPP